MTAQRMLQCHCNPSVTKTGRIDLWNSGGTVRFSAFLIGLSPLLFVYSWCLTREVWRNDSTSANVHSRSIFQILFLFFFNYKCTSDLFMPITLPNLSKENFYQTVSGSQAYMAAKKSAIVPLTVYVVMLSLFFIAVASWCKMNCISLLHWLKSVWKNWFSLNSLLHSNPSLYITLIIRTNTLTQLLNLCFCYILCLNGFIIYLFVQ